MRSIEETEGHNIFKAVDPWLPPGIRNNAALSLEALIRSRILTCVLLCSIGVTIFSFVICSFLYLVTDYDFKNPVIFSTVCFAVVGLDYVYFYRSAKLESSGILYSLSFFIICVIIIVITGGNDSPVRQILVCCPVISFLISGRQEGFYNAALVFVVGVALLILDNIGFKLIQIMPDDILPHLSVIVWLVTITLIVVCLYIYDLLLDEKRSIRAKK